MEDIILSSEALRAYMHMTPRERLIATLQAMKNTLPHLQVGSPDLIRRRKELIDREFQAGERASLARVSEFFEQEREALDEPSLCVAGDPQPTLLPTPQPPPATASSR